MICNFTSKTVGKRLQHVVDNLKVETVYSDAIGLDMCHSCHVGCIFLHYL